MTSNSELDSVCSLNLSDEEKNDPQLEFALLLKDFKVLFNKSLLPEIKNKKEEAMKALLKRYEATIGKNITTIQIRKKINNMKTEVKKIIDKKKTGNKKIVLKKWQKIFSDCLNVEQNPIFQEIPGGIGAGLGLLNKQNMVLVTPISSTKPKKNIIDETDETKSLSMAELQRLVLVKQLHLIKIQSEKETLILEKLKIQKNNINITEYYVENETME